MVADVLVEININDNKAFTYFIPKELESKIKKGMRALVPFGKKEIEGFVINIKPFENIDYELKNIIKLIDEEEVLNEELLSLGKYISNKTFSSLIKAYQTMLPNGLKAKVSKKVNKKFISYIVLNKEVEDLKGKQLEIVSALKKEKKVLKSKLTEISVSALNTLIKKDIVKENLEESYRLNETFENKEKRIELTDKQKNIVNEVLKDKDKFSPFLLHGVTGSGKTEVYIKLIEEVIKEKKEAIVLVPEISLTPQFTEKFKTKFGSVVAVLHSALSDVENMMSGERLEEGKFPLLSELGVLFLRPLLI